jgi:hypothetical protein
MLDYGQVGHFFLTPNLMLGVNFRFGSRFCFLFGGLRLILLAYLCFDFGIGTSHLLFLALVADLPRVKHTALVGIFDNIRVFLAGNELFKGHHGSIVEHGSLYLK